MADVIGAAASIVGLITATITILNKIQQARETMAGASETLGNVSSVIDATSQTLRLVQSEFRLQTIEVGAQIDVVRGIASELGDILARIQKDQRGGSIQKFARALKAGDSDDKVLNAILLRLQNARSELHARISVVHVGLSGSLQDGYRVGLQVLQDTNIKVRQVLGLNLALAERLQNRDLKRLDSNTILLDSTDIVALQLSDQSACNQTSSEHGTGQGQDERLIFHGNITGDEPRTFVGSLGVEDPSKTSNSKANICNSKFGKGARFVVADVGGEAAINFSKSFF